MDVAKGYIGVTDPDWYSLCPMDEAANIAWITASCFAAISIVSMIADT